MFCQQSKPETTGKNISQNIITSATFCNKTRYSFKETYQIYSTWPTDSSTAAENVNGNIKCKTKQANATRHTFMKRLININTAVRWKNNQVRWIVNETRDESIQPFWTFPHCVSPSASIHPLFLLTRIIFLFRCNLPPSSQSVSLPFSSSLCPSVS